MLILVLSILPPKPSHPTWTPPWTGPHESWPCRSADGPAFRSIPWWPSAVSEGKCSFRRSAYASHPGRRYSIEIFFLSICRFSEIIIRKQMLGDQMPENIAERKIRVIPATVKYIKRVGIYCRVSTMHESQDESLAIQIRTLEQIVATTPGWMLFNVYSDKDTGGNVFRPGFQQLIFDWYEDKFDIVLVKTIRGWRRVEAQFVTYWNPLLCEWQDLNSLCLSADFPETVIWLWGSNFAAIRCFLTQLCYHGLRYLKSITELLSRI